MSESVCQELSGCQLPGRRNQYIYFKSTPIKTARSFSCDAHITASHSLYLFLSFSVSVFDHSMKVCVCVTLPKCWFCVCVCVMRISNLKMSLSYAASIWLIYEVFVRFVWMNYIQLPLIYLYHHHLYHVICIVWARN